MKNISRILSCLLIGILCVALLAGCFGSGTGIEALIQKVSAGYSTLTISTYDVDDSGNKELAEEFIYDAEGNILQEYDVISYDDEYVYTYTYSYQKNGLISSMTFMMGNYEYTFNYNYEYDDDGNVASLSADWDIEERDMTTTIYAILSYNTAGNISSVYYNIIVGSSDYSDEEIQEYVKSDDFLSDGVTVDFIYSFDTIEGIYSSRKVTYSSGEEDVYEIESTLEYDENGMIDGIGIQSTDSTPFSRLLVYLDVKFMTAVLKYIDSAQNSNLADRAEYLLYGGSDKDNTFLKIEYDDQGNVISRSYSRGYDRYYEEYPICSYEYEYEYNENGQIQTAYTYLDGEAYQISYYEYE